MAINAEQLLGLSGGVRLLDRQIFTSSGTWTKPADFAGNVSSGKGSFLRLRLIGGGAGGSGGDSTTGGSGGGPGGQHEVIIAISLTGATETVTVGAGGAAGAASAVGSSGGDSLFGALAIAGGGVAPADNNMNFSGAFSLEAFTSRGGVGNVVPGSGGVYYLVGSSTGITSPAIAGGGPGGGGPGGIGSGINRARAGANGNSAAGGAGGSTSAGTAGAASTKNNGGGGGGGGDTTYSGGAGGLYGGGGGGGGGTNGAGGAGAAGIVVGEVWG